MKKNRSIIYVVLAAVIIFATSSLSRGDPVVGLTGPTAHDGVVLTDEEKLPVDPELITNMKKLTPEESDSSRNHIDRAILEQLNVPDSQGDATGVIDGTKASKHNVPNINPAKLTPAGPNSPF